MSKLSRFLNERPELACGFFLFIVLIVHGATIGLTDDEAYYWVLAQQPALGYAYHPPMVAWVIALSQLLFGWALGGASEALVRLPAAFCSAAVLTMGLQWLRSAGVSSNRIYGSAGVLVSLAGLFALSWMMVPDLPLFLGWMICFLTTWRICFGPRDRFRDYVILAAAICLAVLSKFSGVLIALSSLICVFVWAPKERRWNSFGALVLGGLLASIPILLWNMTHEWASILYQIRDRHGGGSLSFVRWARFWAIELFAAGPILILFGFGILPGLFRKDGDSAQKRIYRFLWIWAAPAALIFCLQPLWADFKPHWALVAWWPMALALAWSYAVRGNRWAVYQMRYGLTLGAVVLICCHLPIGNTLIHASGSATPDPRLDVTNDLYGWGKLKAFLKSLPGNEELITPVVGSRYQTASQAYFALGEGALVTMLPRGIDARDEWPDLDVSETVGPDWPELTEPVFFVADNRYDAPPQFPGAHCTQVGKVEESRGGYPAKWILVWRCEPRSAPVSSKQ